MNGEDYVERKNKRASKNKKRIFMPVKRAEVFQDRRLKRRKTRSSQLRAAIQENS